MSRGVWSAHVRDLASACKCVTRSFVLWLVSRKALEKPVRYSLNLWSPKLESILSNSIKKIYIFKEFFHLDQYFGDLLREVRQLLVFLFFGWKSVHRGSVTCLRQHFCLTVRSGLKHFAPTPGFFLLPCTHSPGPHSHPANMWVPTVCPALCFWQRWRRCWLKL